MSFFMPRLQELERLADTWVGGTSVVCYKRDRSRPEAEQWSCWIEQRPDVVAVHSSGLDAMSALFDRIEKVELPR